jgi:hypothetical protein
LLIGLGSGLMLGSHSWLALLPVVRHRVRAEDQMLAAEFPEWSQWRAI